ncbi:MAG TPA: ATP-binding protein [Candidatus Limnocylindrales bacterium]|nr:ATP-binding protein [Candidatus Limnocylindrales bacterium]
MDLRRARRIAGGAAAIVLGVAASSVGVAILEDAIGVENASSLYLVTVAALAIAFGVPAAAASAVVAVGVYDYFFTHPVHTLTVSDPGEWLNLLLLLFVAVTVGQLAGLQRQRAEAAVARERESRALFEVTRALATRDSTGAALPGIAEALARAGAFDVVWFAAGSDEGDERPIGRSRPGALPATSRAYAVLHRPEAGGGHTWTSVRGPALDRGRAASGAGANAAAGTGGGAGISLYRVRMEEAGRPIGSLWAGRDRASGLPDAATTTLLRVAADLVAQALTHDRLEDQTRRAEVAQQSDSLKSALLESVSHDLRTPLASIRASAGTLMDPEVGLPPDEVRASAASIDREAQRLNRLVGNLLDLSRIEAGALRASSEALDLEDVVARSISLVEARAGLRRFEIVASEDSPALADPILLEEVVVNLLENAIRHTPEGSAIRITSSTGSEPSRVRLTVEDSGPGVPAEALPRIFDKFFRGGDGRRSSRTGMGIGLAVVRGFTEAMGGHVAARRSELGGLAIDLELRAAALPAGMEGRR